MADNEATQGATNDVGGTPATNWYHIYVPFNSGTPGLPTAMPSGYAADAPTDGSANDYLPNPQTSVPMGSFLHIGAMNPDLLSLSNITSTNANFDGNAQATFKRALNLTGFVASGFLDDFRARGPNASTMTQRQAESANLYSKGGWRDHTDGNRITTTVGDKVEVIGGNHIMMILGRPTRDNSLDNTLLTGSPSTHQIETSGGISYSNDAGPGHIEEVRWVTRSYPAGASANAPGDGGTWMVRQKSQCCDEVSISAGLTHESFVGIGVEINSGTAYSYHGAIENIPAALLTNTDFNLPDIWRDENLQSGGAMYTGDMPNGTDPSNPPPAPPETLVTSIQNNSGKVYSSTCPVPGQMVVEYAVLDSTYSNTTVGTVTEITTINDSSNATTTVDGNVTETTTITGDKTETTTVDGSNIETTTIHGDTNEISMVAGAKSEVNLLAGASQSVDLCAGNVISVEIALLKEELLLFAAHAEYNQSPEKTTYANDETDIKAMEQKIAPLVTNITAIHNHVSGTATVLADLVAMG